jgi:hypothetical protein
VAKVMVGDRSWRSDLGFDDFQPGDMNILSRAKFVCVFNWPYNRKGTELTESVLGYCKQNSKAQIFFDPADPWSRCDELPDLVRRILRNALVDFLAVNDNEALMLANAVAARHISRPERTYATLHDMTKFLRDPSPKLTNLRKVVKS